MQLIWDQNCVNTSPTVAQLVRNVGICEYVNLSPPHGRHLWFEANTKRLLSEFFNTLVCLSVEMRTSKGTIRLTYHRFKPVPLLLEWVIFATTPTQERCLILWQNQVRLLWFQMNFHELITKKQMKHMIWISSWTPPLTIYKKTAWFQIGVTGNKIEI